MSSRVYIEIYVYIYTYVRIYVEHSIGIYVRSMCKDMLHPISFSRIWTLHDKILKPKFETLHLKPYTLNSNP